MDRLNDFVIAVSSDIMGNGDDELGRTLLKSFLYVVSEQETLPKAIVFYNSGVNATIEGSDCVEDLKIMEEQGVELLICGTCLSFFDVKEKVAVGKVSNMYSIVETLESSSKVIKP